MCHLQAKEPFSQSKFKFSHATLYCYVNEKHPLKMYPEIQYKPTFMLLTIQINNKKTSLDPTSQLFAVEILDNKMFPINKE